MNPLDGYIPPIKIYQTEMQTTLESNVMSISQSMGVDVNKEELLKALAYDRDQYEKGYEAGYNKAYQEMHDKFLNFTVNMRPATPGELQSIKESLNKISTPTGINFWDLYKDKKEEL